MSWHTYVYDFFVWTHICICMKTHVYVWTHICVCIDTFIFMYVYVWTHVCTSINICMYMNGHIYEYFMDICMYMYRHICMQKSIPNIQDRLYHPFKHTYVWSTVSPLFMDDVQMFLKTSVLWNFVDRIIKFTYLLGNAKTVFVCFRAVR